MMESNYNETFKTLNSEAFQVYFDDFTAQLTDEFDEFTTNLLNDECPIDNFFGDIEMTDGGAFDIDQLDILKMPVFNGDAPMTPPYDTRCVDVYGIDGPLDFESSLQDPIEVGANVIVMANVQQPMKIIDASRFMWSEDMHSSSLSPVRSISPYSTISATEEIEIIVDDGSRDDDPDFTPDYNDIDSNDNSCASSEYTEESSQPDLNVPQKRSRGRPKKSPQTLLDKLKGKVTKKERKTIQNNISSIVYRRKKAEEKHKEQDKFAVAQARNIKLREQHEKLESAIKLLKLILK